MGIEYRRLIAKKILFKEFFLTFNDKTLSLQLPYGVRKPYWHKCCGFFSFHSFPCSPLLIYHILRSLISAAHTSFHPPEPPVDHWGLSTPLPVYDKVYTLRRHRGTVGGVFFVVVVLNFYCTYMFKKVAICEDGSDKIVPELEKYYVTRERYLRDYERMIALIADGPL